MSYLELLSRLGIGSAHPGGFSATLELFTEFPQKPGTQLLDVGCGTGRTACWLAGQGLSVTAVDIRPNMIRKARTRAKAEGVNVKWIHGDARRLPFPDLCFDVVSVESVTVFIEPEQALQEYLRVLRPGGILFDREIYATEPLSNDVREAILDVYGIRHIPEVEEWLTYVRQSGFVNVRVWRPTAFPAVSADWNDQQRFPDPLQRVDYSLFGDPQLIDMMIRYDQFMNRYRDRFGYGVLIGEKQL